MSQDDKQDKGPAPGSGAGDAAPTQQVPRIPKPASSTSDEGSATKKPTAKKAAAKKSAPVTTGRSERASKAPLTAADYAHTTKPSPSTTAVMPAVKESTKPRPAPSFSQTTDPGTGRRASLRLTRVEPWSVTRLAFAISVAMMIVGVVAVTIFWVVLDATGVWDEINDSVTSVLSDDSTSFNITDYLGFGRMVGLTLVLSAINVVLMTALATIAAHLYNLGAQLLGGVEVTFAEEK